MIALNNNTSFKLIAVNHTQNSSTLLPFAPNSDRYLQLENMRNENLRNSLKFMLIAYDYDKKRKSLVEMISQIYGILGNKIKEKEFDTISQVLK